MYKIPMVCHGNSRTLSRRPQKAAWTLPTEGRLQYLQPNIKEKELKICTRF